MRIEVTAEDAASPDRGSSCDCMVGRAMRRALPGYWVSVGIHTYIVINRSRSFRLSGFFPPEVADRIERYLRGETVKPFAFDFPEPSS